MINLLKPGRCLFMALASCCLLCPAAQAQTLATQAGNFVVEEDRQVWRFYGDETSSLEKRIVFRALSAAGAQGISSIPLSFQEGWQSLDVVEAYTLKPDGHRLPLPSDAIQKQSGLLGGSTGVSWPEYRAWQFKYPDVQVGDRVVMHYKLNQLKAFLPGWQGSQWFANHNFATEKLGIEVQTPKGMALAVESDGLQTSTSEENDLQIRRFSGKIDAKIYDADARNAATTVARVLVSSLASPEQMADRFAQAMQTQVLPRPDLLALAQSQTGGLSDPAAKARALYDWVRKNIRYTAVFIGAGGWVPHSLDFILSKRYGDCKDQVLLLLSLLKVAGIEAVPALVNTGNDYSLNKVAAGFDHVITYLPALDLYLDPTGSEVPFGELPFGVRGKPVVLARVSGSSLAQTPALAADGNEVESQGDFKLRDNGTLEGTLRITTKGHAAMVMQDRLAQIPPGMGAEAVSRMLEQARLSGTGALRYPALNRDRAVQTLEIDVEIPNFLASPEAGSLSANPMLPGLPVYVLGTFRSFQPDQRRFALPCIPAHVRETFKLKFDPKFSVQRVPTALKLQEQGVRFEAAYSFADQVLSGSRDYSDSNPSMVCDVAQYNQRKAPMRAIARHLRQQLLYQQ